MRVDWCGEQFELLSEGAVHRLRHNTLIVADLHFGKAASFRAAGVPVPSGTTQAQLEKLDAAINRSGANHVVILGDLLHSSNGRSGGMIDAVAQWRARWSELPITLVRGNHDLNAGDPPMAWQMDCVDEPYILHGLCLCHHPDAAMHDMPTMAGHVHPAARIHDHGVSSTRVRCYHFARRLAVLPAFGPFIGSHIINAQTDDRVFGIVDGEIVELTRLLQRQNAG